MLGYSDEMIQYYLREVFQFSLHEILNGEGHELVFDVQLSILPS